VPARKFATASPRQLSTTGGCARYTFWEANGDSMLLLRET